MNKVDKNNSTFTFFFQFKSILNKIGEIGKIKV